jgi:ubiquinone/menaquinone biosynthesis C-methylase UbiE
MGLYSRYIFPRLCDWTLNNSIVAECRREILRHAGGEILEIGFGTGLNLLNYPPEVRKITTVDPHVGMHRLAQKRIRQAGIAVDQYVLSSERLPFEDRRFDSIVSTFTLCSVDAVEKALGELYRVLKPGGRFLFLEHGLSPEPRIQKWQRRLNWLQMRLGDGCRLDREIGALVRAQPFATVETENFYLEKSPKTHGYLYKGIATRGTESPALDA